MEAIKNEVANSSTNEIGKKEAFTEGDKAISLEAKAIAHLFDIVLESKDDKFTEDNKKLINEFFSKASENLDNSCNVEAADEKQQKKQPQVISSKQQVNQALTAEQKLEIIKTALSQRNKYNKDGGKLTDQNRAQGTRYELLKNTLQTLNKKSINFTTESLKLFNDDGKTLGTPEEVDNLIGKKPLFVRAMRKADINKFKKITKDSLGVNEPSHNILLTKPDVASSLGMIVKLTNLKNEISK